MRMSGAFYEDVGALEALELDEADKNVVNTKMFKFLGVHRGRGIACALSFMHEESPYIRSAVLVFGVCFPTLKKARLDK